MFKLIYYCFLDQSLYAWQSAYISQYNDYRGFIFSYVKARIFSSHYKALKCAIDTYGLEDRFDPTNARVNS